MTAHSKSRILSVQILFMVTTLSATWKYIKNSDNSIYHCQGLRDQIHQQDIS